MKTLVIAEKPSVAKDIVKALTPSTGRFMEHDNHYENDTYVVSSAIGHLVEIFVDENTDPKRGRWNLKTLPVIPQEFSVRPIENTKSRLSALVKLIGRKDIDTIINACDAGREGELIFRLIVQYAGGKKPVNKVIQRLWLQSMTPQAILEGFKNLRTDMQMKGLEDAARCRSEADWLVGINGTRAMTAFNSIGGGFSLTTVGRVQTPTLSLLVEREDKIQKHVPRTYHQLDVEFKVKSGKYKGRWFNPNWKKSVDPEDKADRFWEAKQAGDIGVLVTGKNGIIKSEESKTQTQASPLLFDLTSLQRECNSKFGLSAKTTLSIAQALYEKHKVLTYPRTDSKWLPEDYHGTCYQTLGSLKEALPEVSDAVSNLLDNKLLGKVGRKVFDNSKISDHFAIIPTGKFPGGLDDLERKVFNLVFKRFVAVFMPAAEFNVVTRITEVETHVFKSEGKVLTKPGWLTIYGKEGNDDKEAPLMAFVEEGEKPLAQSTSIEEHETKPPARYNEATLLGAMENVSKNMDEGLKEAMGGKGLGTPATRAATIEGLISEKYINRNGKELEATPKAFQLMTLLKGLDIRDLSSPELTGEWEFKLAEMEKGKISRAEFMADISKVVKDIIDKARATNPDNIHVEHNELESGCPSCNNGKVIGKYKSFVCSAGCGFRFPRVIASHLLTHDEAETLVKNREVGPIKHLRNKMGKEFSSKIILKFEAGLNNYVAAFEFEKSTTTQEPMTLGDREPIAKCPCCKSNVYAFSAFYGCEKAVNLGDNLPSCKFKVSKEILQQTIDLEQLQKLVDTGSTDLLENWVSTKKNRKFKAKLVWNKKENRTSFVFEEKKEKKGK